MEISIASPNDLNGILELHTQLHDNKIPQIDSRIAEIWNDIINDKNHHIILGKIKNKIISSCVIMIIPNLTHNQRPYALIENVITDIRYRHKGYATSVLNFAKEIAIKNNCYKIMLLTGSKDECILDFYTRAGYNRNDKTAFIQWL